MMINRAYKRTPSTEVFFNLRQIKLLGNQLKFKKNVELFRFRENLPAGTKMDLQHKEAGSIIGRLVPKVATKRWSKLQT